MRYLFIKTYLIKLITAFFLVLGSSSAIADGKYACTGSIAAGLEWKSGSWRVGKFKTTHALMSIKDGGKTMEYKESSIDVNPILYCSANNLGYLNCADVFGIRNILFEEKSLSGAVSSVLGALLHDKGGQRADLFVMPITCQRL